MVDILGAMDVLTDWLREIVSSAVVLSRSRRPAPWGISMQKQQGVMFHIVTEGTCWLRCSLEPPRPLHQGDLAIVPHGLDHDLVHDPNGEVIPLNEFLQLPAPPAAGPATTIVCGVYLPNAHLEHPILRTLPPVLHFAAARLRNKLALASVLALLTNECEKPSPGGEALIQHLFDALFIYVVRAWVEDADPGRPGWLSALRDPALSKVLSQMHAQPATDWTVESLAQEAGLSRAAFARRFTAQVGEPPLAYLTRWRMSLAARLLKASEAPLVDVAARVGYESEFAFSRAFKKSKGIAPVAFRRAAPLSGP